jgi:tripartite-type tricarboxylate transporter receptor subunit TctC
MNFLTRRTAAVLACAALAVSAPSQAAFPDKPIRIIVPYAPGGSTSAMAQFLAPALGKALGESVYVDHRPGGNTTIGTVAAAKSAADGYTLLLTASSHDVVPLMSSVPYDPFKDFVPVATLAKTEFVLVVNPSLPVRDLAEFVALAKSKPGAMSYGSAGNGSALHLVAESFAQAAGVKMQHVPYKGAGPMTTDLVGGRLQAAFQTPAVAAPFISSGKLRALAVTGNETLAVLPGVPTLAQAGVPNVQASNWFGILAPAGTPKDVIAKLQAGLDAVFAQADFQEKLVSLGFEPFHVAGDRFAADMRAESLRMGKLVQSAGIRIE